MRIVLACTILIAACAEEEVEAAPPGWVGTYAVSVRCGSYPDYAGACTGGLDAAKSMTISDASGGVIRLRFFAANGTQVGQDTELIVEWDGSARMPKLCMNASCTAWYQQSNFWVDPDVTIWQGHLWHNTGTGPFSPHYLRATR
jgi:hypothetical protein